MSRQFGKTALCHLQAETVKVLTFHVETDPAQSEGMRTWSKMNFPSSDGTNVITAQWIIHLGADSCYYNDYLYPGYQHIIIIIMIIISIGVVVASRARNGRQARQLSPRKNKHALMIFALRADSNHVSLIEQYRSHWTERTPKRDVPD